MRGARYNAKLTKVYDSLTDPERVELRQMLEGGLTEADVAELHEQGFAEVKDFGVVVVSEFPVVFCRSAAKDLELFGNSEARAYLNDVIKHIPALSSADALRDCPQPDGWVVKNGPFRIVLGAVNTIPKPVVVAIAVAGISPCRRVWRYLDHHKAMDLLRSGGLYFCRLDRLTGDPEEGRMSAPSRAARIRAFGQVFGGEAEQAVATTEEIFRGTTYVCCWTRRDHESYLAWKHYCGRDSGGFAICSTQRRIAHFWHAQRSKDPDFFLSTVGYLRPEEPLPNSDEGEQMFWKRHWFSDETEERMAIRRPQSGNVHDILARLPGDMPAFEKIPVDLSELVAEIVLNPFASPSQHEEILRTISDRYPSLVNRVRLSEIQETDAGQGVEGPPGSTG